MTNKTHNSVNNKLNKANNTVANNSIKQNNKGNKIMKKSIVLASTIALSTVIAVSASADTINGVQVISNDGHTITLANGQIARIDNNKVYMDGIGEVTLAPDVKPVTIPNQQAPAQSKTPTTSVQGVPTKQQQTPTPVVSNPAAQQTPTKSPNTPVVNNVDPKVPTHNTVAVPTKTPNTPVVTEGPKVPTHNSIATPSKTPGTLVVNVPVKTFPQKNDNTPLPTQTIESHTTTVEKENIKPIVVPKDFNKDIATVKPTKVDSKISPVVETVKSNTVKVPAEVVTYSKPVVKAVVKTASALTTPVVKSTKAVLPHTGDDELINGILFAAGVSAIALAGFISFKLKEEK